MFPCQIRAVPEAIRRDGRQLDGRGDRLRGRRVQLVLDHHRPLQHRTRGVHILHLCVEKQSSQSRAEEVSVLLYQLSFFFHFFINCSLLVGLSYLLLYN